MQQMSMIYPFDMTISNRHQHKDISFDEYLNLPGLSYSSIRNEGVQREVTTKMGFGTDVHNYLLTPKEFRGDLNQVRPVAKKLLEVLGDLITLAVPELAVTCDMEHEGLVMKHKGRIDLYVPGIAVIDIKISGQDVKKSIEFFGYDKQLTGYCLSVGVKKAIIISCHPVKHTIQLEQIKLREDWWENQVLKRGMPIV